MNEDVVWASVTDLLRGVMFLLLLLAVFGGVYAALDWWVDAARSARRRDPELYRKMDRWS